MTSRFNILNSFKGFGEPNNGLWFIGIEEGGSWNEDPARDIKMYEEYSAGYFLSSCAGNRSKIYETISKTVCESASISWQNYKDKILFQKDCGVFQANLYPLGKPKVKTWPDYYKKLFGYGKTDISDYRENVRQTRFPMLRKFWDQSMPIATVCFGSTFWADFRCLLKLNEDKAKPHGNFPFQLYETEKVVLHDFRPLK